MRNFLNIIKGAIELDYSLAGIDMYCIRGIIVFVVLCFFLLLYVFQKRFERRFLSLSTVQSINDKIRQQSVGTYNEKR